MRNNLVFLSIPEENGESDKDYVENVLNIIETQRKIENARIDITLHRAHGKGNFQAGKKRPVVAKFAIPIEKGCGRLQIKLAHPCGISQQFRS